MLHGYALAVTLEFCAETLDSNKWVLDFGGMKPIKEYLVLMFDHKLLVAVDDPGLVYFLALDPEVADIMIVDSVGCEAFSKMIFDWVEAWLLSTGHAPRVQLCSVEVHEHGANSAKYTRK